MLTDLGEKYTRKFNLLYLMKCSLCVISLGINIKQNFDCFSIISINSKKQIGFIFSTQKWSLSKLHWSELHEIWFKIQYLSTVSWLLLISFGSQFWNCWIENTVRIVISSINFGTIPYILINSKQVFHMKKIDLFWRKVLSILPALYMWACSIASTWKQSSMILCQSQPCRRKDQKHPHQQILPHANSVWQFRLEICTSCAISYVSWFW